jgi:diguanylate cyclase (GGDEF)-like protein
MSHEPATLTSTGRETPESPVVAASSPCRLLVVTAGVERGARLRRMLAAAGPHLTCEEVHRPGDARRRLAAGRFDLVLLDLDDADTLLRACSRLFESAPDVPVVALADDPTPDLARRVVALGAEDLVARDELGPGRLARAIACAVERHRRVAALRELSLTDPLTGLYNRRGFAALAEAHRRVLRRTRGQSLLLFADVDELKRVNDRHGHAAGDRAIIASGMVMAGALRASDIVARHGGDEFVALAHDASAGHVETLLRRIRDGVARLNAERSLPFALSLSLGVSTFGPDEGLAAALARADRELHREKRRRREAMAEAARR